MRQFEEKMKEINRQHEIDERFRFFGNDVDQRIARLERKICMLEESVYTDKSNNKTCC